MSQHEVVCLVVFSTFLVLFGLFVYFIDKTCKKDMEEERKRREQLQQEVLIENTKPQFKVVFLAIDGVHHETKPFEAHANYSYRRISGMIGRKNTRIVASHIVADNYLDHAMEKGYITSKDGVRFPTCNILQAKVIQHVPKK